MNLSENSFLREKINERLKIVFTTQAGLIKDAEERGMPLYKSRLSKYLGGQKGGLLEDQILWVATRLGIFVNVNFGKPVLKDGKLSYTITKYDKLESLKMLRKIFGKKED